MKLVKENVNFKRGQDSKKSLDIGVFSTYSIPEKEKEFLEYVFNYYSSEAEGIYNDIFNKKLTNQEILKYWVEFKSDIIDLELNYSTPGREKFRDYMLIKGKFMLLKNLEWKSWIILNINNLKISEEDFSEILGEYEKIQSYYRNYRNELWNIWDREDNGEKIDQVYLEEIESKISNIKEHRRIFKARIDIIVKNNPSLKKMGDFNKFGMTDFSKLAKKNLK